MKKSELVKLIESLKDDDSVIEALSKSEIATKFSKLDIENIKEFLKTNEEGKKYIDNYGDDKVKEEIEKFKKNTMSGLIDEEIKKRFPTKKPEEIELEKLRKEMETIKQQQLKEQLTNKALKIATEKKLPLDLVNFFIGEDENATVNNIENFSKTMDSHLEALVAEKLKDNSYTPPSGGEGNKGEDVGDFMAIISENQVKRN